MIPLGREGELDLIAVGRGSPSDGAPIERGRCVPIPVDMGLSRCLDPLLEGRGEGVSGSEGCTQGDGTSKLLAIPLIEYSHAGLGKVLLKGVFGDAASLSLLG